jgi:hypothetical protein
VPPEVEEPFDPVPILARLAEAAVDFVVIGGVAGGAHGSAYPTYDVDLAYARAFENLERLAAVLRSLHATLRGAPEDAPFQVDARTLEAGGNFTFTTDLGPINVFAYPEGSSGYDRLRADAAAYEIQGHDVRFASLDHLIAMKEATGRPRDKLAASELRVIADELRCGER